MKLTNEYIGNSGVKYLFEYEDVDSFEMLPREKCTQTYAVCFVGEKIVVVNNQKKNTWGLVGGTIEPGEDFVETLHREIQEESNMKVLWERPIGYQKCTDTRDGSVMYQLRFVCEAVPYGPFVSDPAGSVTEMVLIDPKEHKKYFDWKHIGEHIIERGIQLVGEYRKNR